MTNCRTPWKDNRIPFSAASVLSRTSSVSACDRAADAFAQHRIALVGEAAHVIPPIGAQGLNMGLRDAADIADVVGRRHAVRRRPRRAASSETLSVGRGARTSRAVPWPSTWPTVPCSAISCRCRSLRAAGLHLDRSIRSASTSCHARRTGAVMAGDSALKPQSQRQEMRQRAGTNPTCNLLSVARCRTHHRGPATAKVNSRLWL